MRRIQTDLLDSLLREVATRLGFHHDAGDRERLRFLLRDRLAVIGNNDVATYRARLGDPVSGPGELALLADALTIGETYFLRGIDQLEALLTQPSLLARRPLRWLSAGCASGEEPLSLAMLLAEQAEAGHPAAVEIVGIDASAMAIARARRGIFSNWSLREVPAALRERYFRRTVDGHAIAEPLRHAVQFHCGNLLDDDDPIWRQPPFDAIVCRNVLIYFTPSSIEKVLRRLVAHLADDGWLFLSHVEVPHVALPELALQQHGEGMYFRKRAGGATGVTAPAIDVDWFSALNTVSRQVPDAGQQHAPPVSAEEAADHERRLLRDLADERWDVARLQLDGIPQALRDGARIRRLEAAIAFQCGDLPAARVLAEALLADDFLDAEAHYLLGCCDEAALDFTRADAHAQRAVYQSAGPFAFPHLLQARLAQRRGDRAAQSAALRRALALLADESERHLQMFGGGFRRRSLIDLCKAELAQREPSG